MAKKYIISVGGKDLATAPVTQNEMGKYYMNSSGAYFKPVLAEFDKAVLPTGYKAYIGGSHASNISNPNRNPIDFSFISGLTIKMNVDVKIVATNPSDGSWCKAQIVGTDIILAFVHTYLWASGTVKAGDTICKIAPKSVTGFPSHLHMDEWSNKGRKIRELILVGDFKMGSFKVGDKIKVTTVQNIRKGAGTTYGIVRDSKVGEIGSIVGGGTVANGYTWWNVKFSDMTGWVADVGKFVVYIAPAPIDPLAELKAQVAELQGKLKLSSERVAFLEANKKEVELELVTLQQEVDKITAERDMYQKQYMDVVTELNELKASHWTEKLRDEIVGLWNKYKEQILKLIKGR